MVDIERVKQLRKKMEDGSMSVDDIPEYFQIIKEVATESEEIQEETEDWDVVIQFDVLEKLQAWISCKEGSFEIGMGKHDDPSVTLTMNDETAVGLFSGEVDGTSAYMAGNLSIDGPLPEAIKFNTISEIIREEIEEMLD